MVVTWMDAHRIYDLTVAHFVEVCFELRGPRYLNPALLVNSNRLGVRQGFLRGAGGAVGGVTPNSNPYIIVLKLVFLFVKFCL